MGVAGELDRSIELSGFFRQGHVAVHYFPDASIVSELDEWDLTES
jgi:hypothetical protein